MPHKEEHKYIPKNLSKEFRTRHGCECKEEYEYRKDISDKKYTAKNECVLGRYQSAWCRTKDSCGRPLGQKREREQRKNIKNNSSDTWDYCVKDRGAKLLENNITFGKGYLRQQFIGIIFFIIVFVITIPTLLYKLNLHTILEVYMPNFDLLATALSFQDGALGNPYFQELYGEDNENFLGWGSTLFINYLSLLGLTYLVARRVYITKSLRKGWAIGFVMLLLTYLIPNIFITFFQNKVSDLLQSIFLSEKNINKNLGNPEKKNWTFHISNIIILLVGLGIATLFILAEVTLLKQQKYWLDPFVKRIFLIDDLLDKI